VCGGVVLFQAKRAAAVRSCCPFAEAQPANASLA